MTTLSRLRAVIWTDVVQAGILTAGGLLILGTIVARLPGGLDQLLGLRVLRRLRGATADQHDLRRCTEPS